MAYRTLEEKFLADYEELEKQCNRMRSRIDELEAVLEEERGNRMLDLMVKIEGRKAVFEQTVKKWGIPKTSTYEYAEWCMKYIDEDYGGNPKLPKGVSVSEFVDYFEAEFDRAYEKQYEKEAQEAQKEE